MSGPGSGLRGGVENSRLAERMRELRRRTGLTLAALAERTPYSKSSWERYLNAKKLPPRGAVEALCRLAGEPPGQLVALWELADAAWSGRGRSGAGDRASPDQPPPQPPQPPQPQQPPQPLRPPQPPQPQRPPRRVAAAAAGACAGVVAVVVALVFGAAEGAVGSGPVDGAAPRPSEVTGCRAGACDGKDPESMYCELPGVARTPWERTAARGQRVQIRYGTACGAAWGRLRDGRVGDRLEVSVPGAAPRSVRVVDRFDAEGDLVTPMAAARGPEGIRLCLFPAGGGTEECFSR
ncbi:helix-turn-helix domain-containing protein [Streptomyces decoyicus]|uniref:helix-turn-helix domain-containing protein n=1 Tax=Streptomyces decoyicus TaxID=249567 RepID=UPI0033D4E82C